MRNLLPYITMQMVRSRVSIPKKWELVSGTKHINLTLKGLATANAEVKFKGALTEQTIDYTNIKALCFTALSSSDGSATSGGASLQTRGLSIWERRLTPGRLSKSIGQDECSFRKWCYFESMRKLPYRGASRCYHFMEVKQSFYS